MKAVLSFWSRPHRFRTNGEFFTEGELAMWMLCYERLRKHFSSVELVCDEESKEFFVNYVGLEFDEVDCILDSLREVDPRFFAVGKIKAYNHQAAKGKPFVAVDGDALFFKDPPWSPQARFVAQHFSYGLKRFPAPTAAKPRVVGNALEHKHPDWDNYAHTDVWVSICAGVWGGNDCALLKEITDSSLDMIENPRNRRAWSGLHDIAGNLAPSVTIEEWWTAVCLQRLGVGGEYIIPGGVRPDQISCLRDYGFLHVWGGGKQVPWWQERFVTLLAENHPKSYDRWQELTNDYLHLTNGHS